MTDGPRTFDFAAPPIPALPAEQQGGSFGGVHVHVAGGQTPQAPANRFGVYVELPDSIARDPTATAAAIRHLEDQGVLFPGAIKSAEQALPAGQQDTQPQDAGTRVHLVEDGDDHDYDYVRGTLVDGAAPSGSQEQRAADYSYGSPVPNGAVRVPRAKKPIGPKLGAAAVVFALLAGPQWTAIGYSVIREDSSLVTLKEDMQAVPMLGSFWAAITPWSLLEKLP